MPNPTTVPSATSDSDSGPNPVAAVQLKVTIRDNSGLPPRSWRLRVPLSGSLHDLHRVLFVVTGPYDAGHLHQFEIGHHLVRVHVPGALAALSTSSPSLEEIVLAYLRRYQAPLARELEVVQ